MPIEKIIVDEDGGGDTMQVLAVLLAHPENFKVLGVTSVFGNAAHAYSVKNNGDILNFLGASDVPYFPGATHQTSGLELAGDGAHGSDGIGGVRLPQTMIAPQALLSPDFILQSLQDNPPDNITIIAAAPQTNLAQAIAKDPTTMRRVKRIIIMGGCTEAMQAKDIPLRQGNITPYAEFNFQQAAADARTVMGSGLPIVLFPMNCTHQMTVTPERECAVNAALARQPEVVQAIIGIMKAPEALDRMKFDAFPVMHDVHTALYLVRPDIYNGCKGYVDVTVEAGMMNGHTRFRPDDQGNVIVMNRIIKPDVAFDLVIDSLSKCLMRPAAPGAIAQLANRMPGDSPT